MAKKNFKIKRVKSKGKSKFGLIKLILVLVLIGGGVYFAMLYKLPKENNNLTVKAPIYTEAEKYLKDKNIDISLVEKITFMATNNTENAIAGSAVTYWAEVIGLDGSGKVSSQKITDITIAQNGASNNDIKFLTPNTIAILDNDVLGQQLDIKVSLGEASNIFHYNVIQQNVSTDNFALLVNRFTGVEESFEPASLAKSDWIYYTNGYDSSVSNLDSRVNEALESMYTAAKADGFTLYACSGYRYYGMQERLYNGAVASLGVDQQDTAPPGRSEHQTGFAMDITWPSAGGLTQSMENTDEYKWMIENSYKYGFVLRYPKGLSDITGYMYEPWHYRYIGVELATLYHNSGMSTLDEFLSIPR